MEAEIEELNVEQQKAEATALTSPPTTKNDVEVDVIERVKVGKVTKTILTTNTVTFKTGTTNKFEENKVTGTSADYCLL